MTSHSNMAASDKTSTSGTAATGPLERLRRVSKEDVCFKILPALGGVSYQLFSAHIMNPNCFRDLFDDHHVVVANSLWFQSHIGVGLYMFGSKHLQQVSVQRRILYSVFGSFLFNFGSVLFWATCKSLLFPQPVVRTIFGLGSGFVLLFIGREYVEYIDARLSKAS
ncbi:uncharacterized protein LOC124291739 [Haliotis rubra]|uniref:uncharacterized protein LOC124291739 n=1 Tax=Haliotis rubra TaxID=36100 RepID=UPI001EE52777|nr:uncharacterized protein LOC124291739 [Haliotis rubra]